MKTLPALPPIDLKAYFVGQALAGILANPSDKPVRGGAKVSVSEGQRRYIVEEAYELGSRLYELYTQENPPEDDDDIREFNRKVLK